MSSVDPLAEMLDELVPAPERKGIVRTDRVTIDMPLELRVRRAAGRLGVASSAPTQAFRTSVMPVFHRLQAVIVAEEQGGAGP